ncbi:hypothetical protein GCM10027074_67450 [Streptomyces deserti]
MIKSIFDALGHGEDLGEGLVVEGAFTKAARGTVAEGTVVEGTMVGGCVSGEEDVLVEPVRNGHDEVGFLVALQGIP